VKHLRHVKPILALAFALLFHVRIQAQQTPYVVGSTVTGTVYCADSGAPARFAKVLLKSTAPSHAGQDWLQKMQANMPKFTANSGEAAPPPTDDKKRAVAAATKGLDQALDMMGASTAGLDGRFSFSGVKSGTYYVHAIYPGYIDPLSQFSDSDFTSTDPGVRVRLARIPTVTVSGTDSAQAEVRLDRGAALSGRVLYDDGSPASGWTVSVINPKTQDAASALASNAMSSALAMSGAGQVFKTDDLGHYRISGIAAGDYLLAATLTAPPIGINSTNIMDAGGNISLAVFSGDTFNQATARTITLTPGEEQAGLDITVPARSLHTIVGHVIAKSDGHTLNMGLVTIADKSNPTNHRAAAIRDDGSFHFEYLPGGSTYTIEVNDAAEGKNVPGANSFMGMNIPRQEILHKYGTASTEVILGATDIDTVRLTVAQTEWTPPAKQTGDSDISPGDLIKGILDSIPSGSSNSSDAPKP
jgi:hypothetical protein